MIQLTKQARSGSVPRLAMINSFAGFGRISTAVSLPVISTMGIQVCPLPTSILSNHLAFPMCSRQDFTPYMADYLQTWEALNIDFDGLYCGFLGSIRQIEIVKQLLQSSCMHPASGKPLFLLDPVMADHGKFYSTMTTEHCSLLKELIAEADIITPNITEACFLTETPYPGEFFREDLVIPICEKLAQLMNTAQHPGKRIVITGMQNEDSFINYIWEYGQGHACRVKVAGRSRSGTGDLFASILIADALNEVPFRQSVQKASEFIALCIKGTEEADIPLKEGVLFEKYLHLLCKN